MKIKLLKRERINRILSAIYDYPLTIVEAPMGFGKTTAVKGFLAAKKQKPLWITFLNTGEPLSFLWHEFTSEISKVDEEVGTRLQKLGFPVDVPQTAKVLAVLGEIEFKEKTVLLLDDYHLLSNMQFSTLLFQIVSEDMDNLYIVIITRDTTKINFTDLYLKGMCHVISQQQLKFTDDEIYSYCKMMTNTISEADLSNISKYTDGWISLIYMILVALKKGIPVGINDTIDELVEKVLFNSYDKFLQNFLLKLSIMDSFTVEQVLFVTQEEKTHEILKSLHRENSFVFYDDINKIYKIHNVMLDFLKIRQHFKKEELQELYRRLGQWYLERKEFLTAYSYLNRAGAVESILTHLNNPANIRNELIDFEDSLEMFRRAPQELLNKYPIAYLQYILFAIVKGNQGTISVCAKRLDQLEQDFELMKNIDDRYRNRVIAEANIIRKIIMFNHIEETSSRNDFILELLKGEQSYILLRENEFTFGSPHLLYIYFRDQGTFKKILSTIINKFPVHSKYADGCGTGSEYLALAEYELETGGWQAAELNSFKAIYKAKTKDQNSIIICANFNLIRLYILQGKITKAIEMLKQLEKDIAEVNNPIYNTTIDICKGYTYANLDQAEKIPYWLQIGDMSSANFFYQGIAFNYLVYGKAVLLSRNYVKLEMLAESFVDYFSVFSNQLAFIHNSIFEAAAKYQLYGLKTGTAVMESALVKGQADDIIMPFVENATHIMPMVKAIAHNDSNNEYIKRILVFSEQYVESLNSAKLKKVKLSQREIEVLSLTAEGLKREEIANRLFMSQGTVKTHLQNIYQKLETSGKVSAIKIAQMNGLI
ncbi:LuxR C-terminal-related transcriptional regulator [Clostridium kluyveri]|uniref:LuxR family transcriptional regulator n=1 Tax=Clostridium kluyveri TaxID=1534 RepID=A0A1L5F9B1_CLOKL|nr:LuxR C-terminal-related transcriptional regulator [Clostridium kluyveri]APM39589.1 LuxR family transcriptional regulator [Clostridium kluyveri]